MNALENIFRCVIKKGVHPTKLFVESGFQVHPTHSFFSKEQYFRVIPIHENEVVKYIYKISKDPNFKGCLGRSLVYVLQTLNQAPDVLKLNILDEIFMTVPNVIYTKKNFFLLDSFNEKIETIKSSGLLQFWHYKSKIVQESKTQVKKPPKVLSMERLNGCFYILIV